jgi:undecaprenyl-diphosphatase
MTAGRGQGKDAVKKNLVISILIALATIFGLFIVDARIGPPARQLIPQNYDVVPKLITNWGLYVFYAIFAAFFVAALLRKNRRLIDLCLAYLKAQLFFSFAVVRFLKIVLGRARPGNVSEFTFFSFDFRHNSFPSGHAADAFVSGVFLYYMLKKSEYGSYRFLPILYAFFIAISRIFVGVHYPSDVAAGMAVGILGAWIFISRWSEHSA